MTLKQALLLVRPPLRFGDARQVQAVNFLEKVEAAMAATRDCDYCHGDGCQQYSEDEVEVCTCIWELEQSVKEAVIEKLCLYERFPRIITSKDDGAEYERLLGDD
jgi:hypothetical protein